MKLSDNDQEELCRKAAREIESLGRGAMIRLDLQPASVLQLIGLAQLATRHPKLPDSQHAFVHKLVGILKAQVPERCAAMHKLIELGWDKSLDA